MVIMSVRTHGKLFLGRTVLQKGTMKCSGSFPWGSDEVSSYSQSHCKEESSVCSMFLDGVVQSSAK